MLVRRMMIALSSWFLLGTPAFAFQPPAQTEFVPIDKLPPGEVSPAAPFVVAAYAFVWLAVMVYLWTIWRRMNRVETEMHALARKTVRR